MKRAINLYLDEEVIERLKEIAEHEKISISKLIGMWADGEWGLMKDMDFNNAVTTNDKEIK